MALVFMFSSRFVEWILLAFPLWVLLVSLYILWDNLHDRRPSARQPPAAR